MMLHRFTAISVTVICIYCQATCGAPPSRPKFGPDGGMDFLHGVMMHGDSDPGDSHRQEDEFRRLQDLDKQKAEAKANKDGPCEGMDCLHGVLMHDDEKTGVQHMEKKPGPDLEPGRGEQPGPCQGMDCLHGVMMHGDQEPGKDHTNQDAKAVKVPIKIQKSGTTDPEHILHQDIEVHKEEQRTENPKFNGVKSGTSDPEHLLHQGVENVHQEMNKTDNSTAKRGAKPPSVASDPEHLLHGGSNEVHSDKDPTKGGTPAPIRSGAMDPEHFLHGSDGAGIHSPERQKLKQEAVSGSKAPVSPLDPDELIHRHEEKKSSQIGTMTKDEAKDYKQWKSEKATAKPDSGYLGFSFPYISDTILDEIEILKRRYLSKFWSSDETSAGKETGPSELLTPKTPSASVKYDVNTDMRHELEAIGNTEPLRAHSHETAKKDSRKGPKKDL